MLSVDAAASFFSLTFRKIVLLLCDFVDSRVDRDTCWWWSQWNVQVWYQVKPTQREMGFDGLPFVQSVALAATSAASSISSSPATTIIKWLTTVETIKKIELNGAKTSDQRATWLRVKPRESFFWHLSLGLTLLAACLREAGAMADDSIPKSNSNWIVGTFLLSAASGPNQVYLIYCGWLQKQATPQSFNQSLLLCEYIDKIDKNRGDIIGYILVINCALLFLSFYF